MPTLADYQAPYPEAPAGHKRCVIYLPQRDEMMEQGHYQVELIPGRYESCENPSNYEIEGSVQQGVVEGWGYDYWVVTLGETCAKEMQPSHAAVGQTNFIAMKDAPFVRYNSKLPVVVYVPEDADLHYKVWSDEVARAEDPKARTAPVAQPPQQKQRAVAPVEATPARHKDRAVAAAPMSEEAYRPADAMTQEELSPSKVKGKSKKSKSRDIPEDVQPLSNTQESPSRARARAREAAAEADPEGTSPRRLSAVEGRPGQYGVSPRRGSQQAVEQGAREVDASPERMTQTEVSPSRARKASTSPRRISAVEGRQGAERQNVEGLSNMEISPSRARAREAAMEANPEGTSPRRISAVEGRPGQYGVSPRRGSQQAVEQGAPTLDTAEVDAGRDRSIDPLSQVEVSPSRRRASNPVSPPKSPRLSVQYEESRTNNYPSEDNVNAGGSPAQSVENPKYRDEL